MDDVTKVQKAAEIFSIQGEALAKISDLIMQLNPQVEAPPGSKWTEEEIEMLRKAVNQFGHDITKISEVVKTRSATQLKNALKRRIYDAKEGSAASGGVGTPVKQAKYDQVETLTTETVPFDDDFDPNLLEAGGVETATTSEEVVTTAQQQQINKKQQQQAETVGQHQNDDEDEDDEEFMKLDSFISSRPSVGSRTVGGVNEFAVSNVPLHPPLDLHNDNL